MGDAGLFPAYLSAENVILGLFGGLYRARVKKKMGALAHTSGVPERAPLKVTYYSESRAY